MPESEKLLAISRFFGVTLDELMGDQLAKAFITPIEREDIIELSHCIDNITDKIEDVFLRLYTNNIRKMRDGICILGRGEINGGREHARDQDFNIKPQKF